MLQKIVAVIVISLSSFHFFGQKVDLFCLQNIRVGTFITNQNNSESTIVRTKKKQIEYFNNGKSKVVSKLTWTDEENYTLTIVKCINCPDIPVCQKGSVLKVRIIECEGDRFKCKIQLTSEMSLVVVYKMVK